MSLSFSAKKNLKKSKFLKNSRFLPNRKSRHDFGVSVDQNVVCVDVGGGALGAVAVTDEHIAQSGVLFCVRVMRHRTPNSDHEHVLDILEIAEQPENWEKINNSNLYGFLKIYFIYWFC